MEEALSDDKALDNGKAIKAYVFYDSISFLRNGYKL